MITFMVTWLCNTSCMINSLCIATINKYHAWSIAYHSMINRFHAWSTAFHSMINKFHAWSIAYHSMINKFHTWSTWSMIMNDHWSLISYMINGVHKAMINYQAHFFISLSLEFIDSVLGWEEVKQSTTIKDDTTMTGMYLKLLWNKPIQ